MQQVLYVILFKVLLMLIHLSIFKTYLYYYPEKTYLCIYTNEITFISKVILLSIFLTNLFEINLLTYISGKIDKIAIYQVLYFSSLIKSLITLLKLKHYIKLF